MYSRVRPQGFAYGHPVPALGDLRAGGAEAEEEAPAGELVDRRPGHRRRRRGAGGNLEDRGAELDRRRLRGEPGEHADHVGAVGLGGPDRLEAGRLGRLHDLDGILARRADSPVAEVEAQLQISARHPAETYY